MGEIYLCSRTELARALNLDTGVKIGIIGAPKELIEWLDKILPMDTIIVDNLEDIRDATGFKLIIYHPKDDLEKTIEMGSYDVFDEMKEVWLLVHRLENGVELELGPSWEPDMDRIVMLSTRFDVIPAVRTY